MKVYLDSSVALRRLLRSPESLKNWGAWDEVYASTLLRVETMRTIDRLRLDGALNDKLRAGIVQQVEEMCEAIHLVPLHDSILARAGQAFPTVVGTLDALHLATALVLRDQKKIQLTFLTHDSQLGLAAQSMSFPVEGV